MGFAFKLILFNIVIIVILCFIIILNKQYAEFLLSRDLVSSRWRWVVDPFKCFEDYSFIREIPGMMMIVIINALVVINIIAIIYYFLSSS